MRYYIYLDKCFLRTLFSTIEDFDFNIEVIELKEMKSYTTSNLLRLDPSIEKFNDCENSCSQDIECKNADKSNRNNNKTKRQKKGNMNKEKMGVCYDQGRTCNIQTEKRYINIEDVTHMKNTNFYHALTKTLRDNTRGITNKRICEEKGFIHPYLRGDETYPFLVENGFFMINNCYVWFDKTLLECDLSLLSKMECSVCVVGYTMNCLGENSIENKKIIKALAIFIE
ncbi:MAG: hypothetical protein RSE00_02060 [Clostridia bacterium]